VTEPLLGERFAGALAYTFELHRTQRRKGSHAPYLAHLLGVSALVMEHGGDEDQAIAGLLHDALEDQRHRTSPEEIERRYGARVRQIVEGCTDTLLVEPVEPGRKADWRLRKEAYLAHLATTEDDILLVSLADKLYNARAILEDHGEVGEELWLRFGKGRDAQLWYYRSLADLFVERLPGPMASELARVVGEIERAVELTAG
jgi:(p)ppGpp synthase/HD superfamily hydrolase